MKFETNHITGIIGTTCSVIAIISYLFFFIFFDNYVAAGDRPVLVFIMFFFFAHDGSVTAVIATVLLIYNYRHFKDENQQREVSNLDAIITLLLIVTVVLTAVVQIIVFTIVSHLFLPY